MDDPAPSVRLTELIDSDVGLQSRIWIANPSRADFVRTRGEYIQQLNSGSMRRELISPTQSGRLKETSSLPIGKLSLKRLNDNAAVGSFSLS